jgi:hypothetical protein
LRILDQPLKTQGKRTDLPYEGAGSSRDIADWLDKNTGSVMKLR